ncbi:hypothetical protein MicvaDRAFT_5319 [Microcoleus vaginatus FGP-2]|nr:hypothetical protein MicvaDRAFT_5319 [Microcoleus vaginatus FGP-2]
MNYFGTVFNDRVVITDVVPASYTLPEVTKNGS